MLTMGAADPPPTGGLAEICELWGWSVPLALLGSWTCFAALPGINWPLWTLSAVSGFVIVRRRSQALDAASRRAEGLSRLALALAALLSGAAAITANPHSEALTFLAVAALCAFAVLVVTRPTEEIEPSALVRAPLALSRMVFAEAAARFVDTFAAVRMREAVPIARGGAMAAVIAASLFLLLSAADPTLSGWRDAAWSMIASWTFLARDLFFIILATFLLGTYGLAARARSYTASAPRPSLPAAELSPRAPALGRRFSGTERLMVLGTALALFVLFFALELASRLGSAGPHLAPGETLAEATHRGFGEMIVAAVLCAVVIIALERRALRGRREPLVQLTAWSLIGASILTVASAYDRVRFYEAAYGYTEPRLNAQVCCGAVAISLLLLAWELGSALDLPRLTRRVGLVAIVCIAGLSYWNGTAWIVSADIERYERTGKLDPTYLAKLGSRSPDAIPELIRALPRLTPSDAKRIREALRNAPLARALRGSSSARREPVWYEWSERRAAARSAMRAAGLLDASSPR